MLLGVIQELAFHPLGYVALFLTAIYFFLLRSDQPANIPPVPQRPYPILGHFPMMSKDPRRKMKEWYGKSGDIFSIYIGNKLTVVMSSYDVLKEALVKQADAFSDRPQLYVASMTPHGYKGIGASSGENWKEQRTVTLSILRSFGMGKNSLAEKIGEEVEAYLNALSDLKGKPSNVRMLTNNCVSNIICNIIVGKRFDLGDSEFIELLESLNETIILAGRASILNVYPWLRFLPGDPFKARKIVANSYKVLDFWRNRYIKPISDKVDDDNTPDNLIVEYVKEMRKKKARGTPTTMDEWNLNRVILNLFVAGSETTSTTIIWFLLFMLQHQDIYQKVQKEIEDAVGAERVPSIHDKPKLNYLSACIMETQRLGSIVPFSVRHVCSRTTTVSGYTIPKGAVILPNLDQVLWDKKTWGDPENFRPERFLDDKGNLKSMEEFVPFSLGRRVCLGESLAKMELNLFLSALCQRFDIQPEEEGKIPPLKRVFGGASPPEAYKIRFIERRA